MGRKRIPEKEKKRPIKITLRASDIDELRERGINVSSLVQDFVSDYLQKLDQNEPK